VQPGLTGMDLMDSVDILTSIYGGWIDMVPSYIGGRLYGLPSDNSYTEEVAGSSPVPPTLLPPGMGVSIQLGSRYGGISVTRPEWGNSLVQSGADLV